MDALFGWDTAFVTTVQTINRGIVEQKTSPTSVDYDDDGLRLTGTFSPWQISCGPLASGQNMVLAIPFKGSVTGKGVAPFTVDDTFYFTVTLEFVERLGNAQPVGVVNPKTQAATTYDLMPTAASTVTMNVGSGTSDDYQTTALALQDWLQNNLVTFTQVFAAVTAWQAGLVADYEWLRPTAFTYATNGPDTDATETNSVFAMLCRIEGRDPTGLPQQVSPTLLPDGSMDAFAMSEQVVLEKIIRPTLCKALYDLDENLLYTPADTVSLKNKSPIVFPDLDVGSAGTAHAPTIDADNLTVTVGDDGSFSVDLFNLHFAWPDGTSDASLDTTLRCTFALNADRIALVPVGTLTAKVRLVVNQQGIKWEEYSQIAVALVCAVASVAAAGAGAVSSSVDAATATVATDTVETDVASISGADDDAATSEADAELVQRVPPRVRVANLAWRVGKRMAKVLAIAGASFAVIKYPDIERAVAESTADADVAPGLSVMAGDLLTTTLWNNTQTTTVQCESVQLINKCFILGLRRA